MVNLLQESELQSEIKSAFEVTDLSSANWVFKKLEAINAKEKEIKDLAQSEIDRIKEWESKELESLQGNKEYLEYLVTEYYRAEKEKDSKFKLNTPYGKVTSRKGSKVFEVKNEQDVIDQLEQRGFTDFVKTTKKLNQAGMKKAFNVSDDGTVIDDNGEVLDGIRMVEKPTSYSVKVGL
ncbi:hypothetical protein GJU84_04720 [Staphylococcus chromogenes]|uniref:host-nuclease inhibitor Gam family protein n=1 Tax=Staphylococcus chromogenes TaxID=46126 RepID=UPI001404BF85|nr:host-nuclease inhibitor Gam family protein [Staphylococcus chromogenes]QIN26365.1 hypothetical protein GJU84_04720 [Staphylococcus chromogenes]